MAHIIGTSVSETTAEMMIVTASVMANSWNSRPTTAPMNNRGISTAISEIVSEMMVKPICSEPRSAASSGSMPPSTKRAMFSIMTMASSTTKPVAMVSAISDRLSRLKPSRYITPNVPTSDSGTDRLGMMVPGSVRRNTKITITTRTTASASSNSTSETEARMVTVRSLIALTSTAAGSPAMICGSSAWMRSTTWMMLAPGWRCTLRMIAGVVLAQAPSLVFSGPLTMVATSESRTGPPLR